jgi:hypothetical protein
MKWARPGKEGKSGESTCAGGVAGRSRAFRWAESDAELKTLTYPGCQGTTTRSTPDPDKRPSDAEQVKRLVAAVGAVTGGCYRTALAGTSTHTNVDSRRCLGPNSSDGALVKGARQRLCG